MFHNSLTQQKTNFKHLTNLDGKTKSSLILFRRRKIFPGVFILFHKRKKKQQPSFKIFYVNKTQTTLFLFCLNVLFIWLECSLLDRTGVTQVIFPLVEFKYLYLSDINVAIEIR